jgi:hypothetical protein
MLANLVWSGWAAAQRDGATEPGHDLVLRLCDGAAEPILDLCGRRPDPLEVLRGVAQRRVDPTLAS